MPSKKAKWFIVLMILFVTFAGILIIFHKNKPLIKIGYTASPLLSSLYIAEKNKDWDKNFQLVRFSTSSDLGYALISGKIAAGFMEPGKAMILNKNKGFRRLKVIGKITYPYGGILVIKKGLHLKTTELEGHTIAASEPECSLFLAFKKDLEWLNVNPKKIKFEFMPFDSMIPAIEAGLVDGAIMKSSYGIVAQKLGHSIPYIQWDVAVGDQCCPAIVAQTDFLFLAQKNETKISAILSPLLIAAVKEKDVDVRLATSEKTGIPLNIINSLPMASYSAADDQLLKIFQQHDR
jgi:ABC-type nitrate/sulfonate/bicarbonate transport system substrate-binding protein